MTRDRIAQRGGIKDDMSRQGRGKSRAHSRRGNRYDGSQIHIKQRREAGKPPRARRHDGAERHGYPNGARMFIACLLPLLLAWGMQYLHLMPIDRPVQGYWAQWWQGAKVLFGCLFGGGVLLAFALVLLPIAARSPR